MSEELIKNDAPSNAWKLRYPNEYVKETSIGVINTLYELETYATDTQWELIDLAIQRLQSVL